MDTGSASIASEHARYLIQAEWTAELRATILAKIKLPTKARVLEVGSGTGAITSSIAEQLPASAIFGVDIAHAMNIFARQDRAELHYTTADGHLLPFLKDSFDAAFTHFLLLWVRDPELVIREMVRVVKPGGWIIAFAEPDYGGRIDYPAELERIGRLQIEALVQAGADTECGRTVRGRFANAGLSPLVSGVLGGEWQAHLEARHTRSEWETLKTDLGGKITPDKLNQLESLDRQAWEDQQRILFVPTFYAYGQVI